MQEVSKITHVTTRKTYFPQLHWWYFKSPVFIATPVSTRIRIRFSSSSWLPRCRHTYRSELVILIGIGIFGEDEMLVTRTKIAYQQGLPIAGEVSHFSAGLLGDELP